MDSHADEIKDALARWKQGENVKLNGKDLKEVFKPGTRVCWGEGSLYSGYWATVLLVGIIPNTRRGLSPGKNGSILAGTPGILIYWDPKHDNASWNKPVEHSAEFWNSADLCLDCPVSEAEGNFLCWMSIQDLGTVAIKP
jgi:hypothetical protein